jgi:hypothetical protein
MPIRQKPAIERRSEVRPTILQTGLIDEIVVVLLEFGGSAHRDSVIVRVAARRGLDEVPDRLRRDLLNAFDLHRAGAGDPERLLWLPFGDGSRRWALTPEAFQVVAARQRAAGMAAESSVEFAPVQLAAAWAR